MKIIVRALLSHYDNDPAHSERESAVLLRYKAGSWCNNEGQPSDEDCPDVV